MTGTLPERWSVSAHRAYRTCPRQFWLMYVARVSRTDSPESIRGQVMHAGMAAGWEADWSLEGTAPQPDAEDGFVPATPEEEIFEAMELEARRHGLNIADIYAGADFGEWQETVLFALKRLRPQPGETVYDTEREVEGELDGVPLMARIDYLFFRGATLCVWDGKSAKELPRREAVRRDTQLGLGAFLAGQEFDITNIRVAIASIGSGVACEVDMPPDMAQAAARRVAGTARQAEADIAFAPVRGEACASCKVRKHCPLFATGPVPEPAR